MKWTDIGKNARKFEKTWKETTGEEKKFDQSFMNDFFSVYGVSRDKYSFQYTVRLNTGEIRWADCFWPGVILIEMKSKGQKKAELETAYAQALEYYYAIEEEIRPKFILVCDFNVFELYNMEGVSKAPTRFTLKEFPTRIRVFDVFLGVETKWKPAGNDDLNIKAAYKMAKLHDKMAALGYSGHELEVYLVRLMFCLFAEDTEIFGSGFFYDYIQGCKEDGSDLGSRISDLFEVLDMPPEVREKKPMLSAELKRFQYIDGSLFAEVLHRSDFDAEMRKILLSCCDFNWEQIKPEIFGAMFQGVMSPEERRELGAHYTSEENILKVIRPLFLDSLWKEFERSKTSKRNLEVFHEKLGKLKFLDPACGCGNFLIVTYRELRKLEIQVLRALRDDYRQKVLDVGDICKVNVHQFYGIEYEEFPSQIARVGMWLCDHLMNREASETFGGNQARLPLKEAAHITCGNALRVDWETIVSKNELRYIMGNPPFVGFSYQTKEQKEDLALLTKSKSLDYVGAWYLKAAEYIQNTSIQVAFVSTNSITQGEPVAFLWDDLLYKFGVGITFAYQTFIWSNEAKGKAAVNCVIIGFDVESQKNRLKWLYDENGEKKVVKNISPYLTDMPNVIVKSRRAALCNVPPMKYGNKIIDDGNFIIENDEYNDFIKKEPQAIPYIRKFTGSREFINNLDRYILYLEGVSPEELRKCPLIMKRVEGVRTFRLRSPAESIRQKAETPTLYGQRTHTDEDYILVPRVSSERRKYVPMGFVEKNIVASDLVNIIPGGTLYHFGILMSQIHMAWMRAVCGRLEMRYRYTRDVVYNTFPWPETTDAQKEEISKLAQDVLGARALFPESSLADLYDPLTMPPELLKAHKNLDKAVAKAYGISYQTDAEIVAFLMQKYLELTKGKA